MRRQNHSSSADTKKTSRKATKGHGSSTGAVFACQHNSAAGLCAALVMATEAGRSEKHGRHAQVGQQGVGHRMAWMPSEAVMSLWPVKGRRECMTSLLSMRITSPLCHLNGTDSSSISFTASAITAPSR